MTNQVYIIENIQIPDIINIFENEKKLVKYWDELNQRQKRKLCRNNPSLRKRMKRR